MAIAELRGALAEFRGRNQEASQLRLLQAQRVFGQAVNLLQESPHRRLRWDIAIMLIPPLSIIGLPVIAAAAKAN